MNKNVILICTLLVLGISARAVDFAFINMQTPDTVYLGETFELDWGLTILDNNQAQNIEVDFYLSDDTQLDGSDYYFTSDANSIGGEVGYTSKREYDLQIDLGDFPIGRKYIIMHIDPDNKVNESNEGNNIRAYDLYIFTRQADLSVLTATTGISEADNNTLVFEHLFFNAGLEPLSDVVYQVNLANTEQGLTSPLLTLQDTIDIYSLEERLLTLNLTADVSGLGLDQNFVVETKIIETTPGDIDASNNTFIESLVWDDLEVVKLNTQILYMDDDRNDTIRTCNAVVYDDGGPLQDYSHGINSTIHFEPDTPGQVVTFKLLKDFKLFAFSDELSFWDSGVSETEAVAEWYHIYSGTERNYSSTADDGSLTLKFRTDGSDNNDGFQLIVGCLDTNAIYVFPKSGNDAITTCDTLIYDDGKFGEYASNVDASVTIYPSIPGDAIALDFDEFVLEQGYDDFYIYDGENTSAPLLGEYTGSNNPGKVAATNPTGALTVRFDTDGSGVRNGFNFTVGCKTPDLLTINDVKTISTCDTIVYDNGKHLNYNDDSYGRLTIYADEENYPVEITIAELDLEDGQDFLRVYNGGETSTELLETITGNSKPGKITSTDSLGALTLEFLSNESVNGEGFVIYTGCKTGKHIMRKNMHDTLETCEFRIFDNAGEDTPYLVDANDKLTLLADNDSSQLVLDFNVWDLRDGYAKLFVYDGYETTSEFLLAELDGADDVTQFIPPLGSEAITLQFVAFNYANSSYEGFDIDLSCRVPQFLDIPVSGKDIVVSCDTTVYDNGGLNPYAPGSNGRLVIYPTVPGKKVEINSVFWNIDRYDDVLTIYNGDEALPQNKLDDYDWNGPNGVVSTADNGALTLELISDEGGSYFYKGFELAVGCFVPKFNMGEGVNTLTTCDHLIYDHGGPTGDYANNRNDVLTIYPEDPEADIVVTVKSLQNQFWSDYLHIHNGEDESGWKFISLSELNTNQEYVYTSNDPSGAITLVFESSSSTTNAGYEVLVNCLKDGLILNTQELLSAAPELAVYPNPSNGNFSLATSLNKTEMNVSIYTSSNQLVFKGTASDDMNLKLDGVLSPGVYILEASSGEDTFVQKLIIE